MATKNETPAEADKEEPEGADAKDAAAPIQIKPLINIAFIRWHGFCSSAPAAAWESGRHTR